MSEIVLNMKMKNNPAKRGNPYQKVDDDGNFIKMSSKNEWENNGKLLLIDSNITKPENSQYKEEYAHSFKCPECQNKMYGFPNECENCEVEYQW